MTLFELAGALGAFVGLFAGAKLGYDLAGGIGLAAGAAAGMVAGLVSGMGAVGGLFGVGIFLERMGKRSGLSSSFGRYWDRSHTAAWSAAKDQLVGGQTVRGKVVLEKYYGRFLDVGVGFPALLKAVDDSGGLTAELPSLGNDAEALVLEFDDANREVVLTRRDRWWVVSHGAPVGYLVGEPPIRNDGDAIYFAITSRAHDEFRVRLEREMSITCALVRGREKPTPVSVEREPGARGGAIKIREL